MDIQKLTSTLLSADAVKGLSQRSGASTGEVKKVLSQALPALLGGVEAQAKGADTAEDATQAPEEVVTGTVFVFNYEGAKVIPALRYCDYVIINELECCAIWGLEARTPSGALNRQNLESAMRKTKAAGVKEKVIVHCKECSFALSDKDEIITVPSLKIPKSEIKGTVGAGDAFCAGSLYGIYSGYGDRQILEFASAAAACNLFAANSVDGMKTKNEILEVAEKYGRIEQ